MIADEIIIKYIAGPTGLFIRPTFETKDTRYDSGQ